ncbi:mRNA binding protein puf3 [Sporothrix curviconia]|uniref:mRNA binding protein puf3 n=1 Tax=Sporothrix curviconia TaxID=1260050 RepID=A0ABP0AXH3_9PEZI
MLTVALAPLGNDEPFTNGHQASKAYPTAPPASGVWTQQPGPWNNADSNAAVRRTASSPSPARQRDSANDLSNGLSSTSSLFAIGQNGAYSNGRTKAINGTSADTSNGTYRYTSPLRDSVADGEDDPNSITNSLSNLGLDSEALPSRTRASHNSSSVFSAPSAAASVAGSTTSTSAAPGPANGSAGTNGNSNGLSSFGSFGPITSSSHGHSHRTSLHTSTSYSSPAAPAHALPYHRNSQPEDANSLAMAQLFRQSQALEDQAADLSMNGMRNNFAAYAQSQAQAQAQAQASFQFNPVSEPWDAGVRGFDMYGQGREAAAAVAFSSARSHFGSAERGNTPIGGLFRQQQGNSPRGLGTPANAGPWSRPQSHDPRMSGLLDGSVSGTSNLLPRQPLQNYLHDQQVSVAAAAAAAAAASYGGNPNYLPANLPYPLYNSFRAPVQMSPLGIQLGPSISMGNPLVPGPSHIQPVRDRDIVRSMRSAVLEDFRTSRTNRKFELRDIYGHIVEFSGDQHGSRFIQSKLETANSDDKEHIFREISANALVLMRDVFGNYVVQKFFEHGSQVQKKYLAEQMRGKMVELSTQAYACRVVQKALEHILVDQQILLVQELEADITKVIKDPSGNHVVQKVIEVVPREHIGFVMDAFRGNVKELSSHNYGCRVVQRMLEHGSEEDKAAILAELHANARDLIMDQYGNYVTQHVIEFGQPAERSKLINAVLDDLVPLSRHKFASNVVEKCMQHGTVDDRIRARRELDRVGSDGVPVLQQIIKDQYGNYVIQRLLKVLEGDELRIFVQTMEAQLAILKRTSTGRQNAAVDRLLEEIAKTGVTSDGGSPEIKSYAASTAPVSPRLATNAAESTPPLTNAPNTPESSNPPSVSAGPTGVSMVAKADGKTKTVTTKITVSSDADTQTAE